MVAAASSTVTFWPADVVIVKPDVDMLLTVPVVPPAAGDRALDPPPPGPGLEAAELLLADGELLAAAAPLLDVALTIP